MVLRSDEAANEAEVERDQKFRGNVKKAIGTAASIGTAGGAAALAGPIASKVMPFLNQFIPAGLAMKGINKVSPKLGSFLQKGQEMGLDVEEGLNFIKEKLTGGQQQAKENRNVVQQYSDNLHQYISGLIKLGNTPLQAAAKSKKFLDKKEQDLIKKIEKDHKTDWASILESIYGSGQSAQPQSQQPNALGQEAMNPPGSQPMRPPSAESQAFQQRAEEPQPMQQLGQGQAKQQLMQAMQALSQKLRT